jgi:hypothetical protein
MFHAWALDSTGIGLPLARAPLSRQAAQSCQRRPRRSTLGDLPSRDAVYRDADPMLGGWDRPGAERPATQSVKYVGISHLAGGASDHNAPAAVIEGLARVDFKGDRAAASEGTQLSAVCSAKEYGLILGEVVHGQDIELAVERESNAADIGFELEKPQGFLAAEGVNTCAATIHEPHGSRPQTRKRSPAEVAVAMMGK